MSKPSEIQGLLGQVRQAADKLKTRIHELDSQIETLYVQRNTIVSAPLSKADYMATIRADIQTKARSFAGKLRRHLEAGAKVNYPAVALAGAGGLSIRYTDAGTPVPGDMAEDAYFFYFEDALVSGVERALDAKQWPLSTVSVVERRKSLEGIAAQIDALTVERDALAGELVSCGLNE